MHTHDRPSNTIALELYAHLCELIHHDIVREWKISVKSNIFLQKCEWVKISLNEIIIKGNGTARPNTNFCFDDENVNDSLEHFSSHFSGTPRMLFEFRKQTTLLKMWKMRAKKCSKESENLLCAFYGVMQEIKLLWVTARHEREL